MHWLSQFATHEFPTLAARPKYSALNCHKIQGAFDLSIPGWKESLTGIKSNLSG
jgi:dTDP-4-dehydrorhamnose reductase